MLQVAEPQLKLWTREEYYRLAEGGYFDDQNVQLIEGEIIEMPPQKHAHALAVSLMAKFVRSAFGTGYWVREEKPLRLEPDSEPEPDVAVVEGDEHRFHDHPATALIVVEVSDSSLALDRGRKQSIYARAGVSEYWIVNLVDQQIEVYRGPAAGEGRYEDVQIVKPGETVAPLARPQASLVVSELFR